MKGYLDNLGGVENENERQRIGEGWWRWDGNCEGEVKQQKTEPKCNPASPGYSEKQKHNSNSSN